MRILTLSLNIPLHPGDIPAFRGAIIELVGQEHEIFHNHDNANSDEGYFHYGYPLIQYTVRRGRATLVGVGDGADALQQVLVPKLLGEFQFAERTHHLNGWHMKEFRPDWRILDEPQQFGLYGWLALNQDNFKDWKANALPEARKTILDRALTGHLRVLAKAAKIEALDQVIGHVERIDNQKRAAFHGTQFVRFHTLISSTLALPYGINIGRAAAFGFGELMPVQVYQRILQHHSSAAVADL